MLARWTRHRAPALALLVCLTELIVHACGVRFDAAPDKFAGNIYLLDASWLQHDLARSLWNLHSQPPLFNLICGLALKLSPTYWAQILHALWILFSIAAVLGVDRLALQFGASPRLAFVCAALLAISPAFTLYGNALMTEMPCTAAITWSLALSREPRRQWRSSALCTIAALLKPFFAPLFVLIYFLLLTHRTSLRSKLLSALPLLLLAVLLLKNLLLFGVFGTSSWPGMNLARTSVARLTVQERDSLVSSGELSFASSIEPLSPADEYAKLSGQPLAMRGIPALDLAYKPEGAINLNQSIYPHISKLLLEDHLTVLRRFPSVVALAWADGALQFLRPSGEYHWLAGNEAALGGWNRFWNWTGLPFPLPILISGHSEIFLSTLFLLVATFLIAWRRRRDLTHSLAALTLAWIVLAGIFGEVGENNRLRFPSVPIAAALLAAWLSHRRTRRA